LSRRGYHLTREYGIDPLEIVIVRDLMSPIEHETGSIAKTALPEFFIYSDDTSRSAAELMATAGVASLPVVERATRRITGSIAIQDLLKGRSNAFVRETERLRLFREPEVEFDEQV
jgi:CBS domain-containing protein